MGFLKKLLGFGVAAGAGAAAVKVAEKVKENNPAGFADEEGKTDPKAVVDEVVRAAGEFCHETADVVKEKAPEVVDKVKDLAGISVSIEIERDQPAPASEESDEDPAE